MTDAPVSWRRKFFIIWSGQAVSLITSAILQMAFIYYLTQTTGSAMVLSLASLAGFLPYAVLGPLIGVYVDRYSRKMIMIAADLTIAAAGAVLAVVSLYGPLPVWLILVVLFVRSVGTAFHSPALSAATPLLVPEAELTRYAGFSQSLQSVSFILSPALAALLYAVWDLNRIILLDVLGAAIASLSVALVALPELDPSQRPERRHVLLEMKSGFQALRGDEGLFALLLIGTLYMFVYMPLNALYPLMSMSYFGGTPVHVSITEIAYASGMLAGGLLLALFARFRRRTLLIAGSILLMGLSLVGSGLLPPGGFAGFVVCCLLMGFSVPFYSGIQMALFQERIRPEYLGRVFSLTGSFMSLAMPVGLMLSGLLADRVGVNRWFLFSGFATIAIAAIGPLVPAIRRLDSPAPAPETDLQP